MSALVLDPPETGKHGVDSLVPFFRPRGVAVVGASPDPASIGHRLLDALVRCGYPGPLHPVHPRAGEILGLRAYRSVRAVPGPLDLAVVAVPRQAVLEVVEDCAARGVSALIVVSAGFAEVGPEGRRLQEHLLAKVRAGGMRMVGPNCLGVVANTPGARLNATFVRVDTPPGPVAMSSDSGALGLVVLQEATRLGIGVSACVSVGNRADVSSNDLLEYWEQDDATEVILLYLESFGNPRRFARIARRVGRTKPIVAVKAGRTRAGFRAAGSHTAALAVRDVAVDALFHQTGILRAETLEELFDLAAVLETQPLPGGNRTAVLTNAGGPAILCADACEGAGLILPEFSPALRSRLAEYLPPAACLANPVDMIASATPEDYARTLRHVLRSGEADAVIVIHVSAGTPPLEEFRRAIVETAAAERAAARPILACLMPEAAGLRLVGEGPVRIPCFAFPETPARVLGKLAAHAAWRSRPLGCVPEFSNLELDAAREICRTAAQRPGDGWLSTAETLDLLRCAGLPLVPGDIARTAEEAAARAAAIGFPVAAKLASQRLVHKTEVGGVHLNLRDEAAVRQAFADIGTRLAAAGDEAAMDGVLVQPMIAGGTEVLVGVTQDPVFGPLAAFGLGGIHAEVLGDVVFRVTPLTDRDVAEMVRGIRGYRLLEGYRGHPAADLGALEEVLLRVSALVEAVPEIAELDLNPVIALAPGEGCRIVDARVRAVSATRAP